MSRCRTGICSSKRQPITHIWAWPMYVLVIPLLLWTGGLLRWYFRQQGGPRTPGRGRSLISVWQVSAVMVLLSMASKSSSRKAIRALLNRGRRQWPPHDGHLVCSGSSRNEGRRIVGQRTLALTAPETKLGWPPPAKPCYERQKQPAALSERPTAFERTATAT